MQKYEKYRDSGIEWIGEIPVHWDVVRLKWITKLNYGESLKNEFREAGTIPVYGSNGIVGNHQIAISDAPCIIVGRKGSYGKLNFSNEKCFPIDTTYYIDSTATDNDIRLLYYAMLLLNLDSFSKDSAVPGLSRDEAYYKCLPLQPKLEQTAIANYLDHKTAEIDNLLSKKEQLLKLYQEEKTALIN